MKSNKIADLLSLGIFLGASLAAGVVRGDLVKTFQLAKTGEAVFTLPSPEHVVVLSLGYRAAFADYLYGDCLVQSGIHFAEKRRFEVAGRYLDTINELAPKFRQPYLFTDTLLTLQAVVPDQEDYRTARRILRRGTVERPFDQKVWHTAGQYMAYLAAPHIIDLEEKASFKLEGAKIIARSCELVGEDEEPPFGCVVAAKLLNRAGEVEAMTTMLLRVLAVTDDQTVRQRALAYLTVRDRGRARVRIEDFENAWKSDLDFVSKHLILVVGPSTEAGSCAGSAHSGEIGCETSWAEWATNITKRMALASDD